MTDYYRQLLAGIPLEKVQPVGDHWADELARGLDNLPMTQPATVAARLQHLLGKMLEGHSDGRSRLRLLAQIQVFVPPLLDGLFRHIVAESHPLPVAKAKLAACLLEVRSLQLRNTSMAVWEMAASGGRLPLLGRGRVTQVLNEALVLARDVLALSFQQYQWPPRNTWKQLHALFGYALERGIADRAVRINGEACKRSVRQRYAHALLLAMANPWGMQRAELVQADAVCGALADQVRVGSDNGGVAVCGDDEDSGPAHAAPGDGLTAGGLRVDCTPALEMLDAQLASLPEDRVLVSLGDGCGGRLELQRDMLERMSRAWHGRTQRDFERIQSRYTMPVLIGMSAIHQAAAGGVGFDAFQTQLAGDETAARVAGNAAAWLSGHEQTGPAYINAEVLDQSLGGYRLLWPASRSHRVRLGELVGLLPGHAPGDDANAGAVLMLGVLRWLRGADGDRLSVGVELLSRSVLPAVARVLDERGRQGVAQRALLMETAGEERELVLAQIGELRSDHVELSSPPDPDCPGSRSLDRQSFGMTQVEELSPAYYRVSLAHAHADDSSAAHDDQSRN